MIVPKGTEICWPCAPKAFVLAGSTVLLGMLANVKPLWSILASLAVLFLFIPYKKKEEPQ